MFFVYVRMYFSVLNVIKLWLIFQVLIATFTLLKLKTYSIYRIFLFLYTRNIQNDAPFKNDAHLDPGSKKTKFGPTPIHTRRHTHTHIYIYTYIYAHTHIHTSTQRDKQTLVWRRAMTNYVYTSLHEDEKMESYTLKKDISIHRNKRKRKDSRQDYKNLQQKVERRKT